MMEGLITAKFGGTSLATAGNIRRVAQIIHADPDRRFVVVSAPGRRFAEDLKITDQLYRYQVTKNPEDFDPIQRRYEDICEDLGLDLDLSDDFALIRSRPHTADYLASRGEYLSAKVLAAFLGWPFVDTKDCVWFDEDGLLDGPRTQAALKDRLADLEHAVLPGFYGSMPDGQIHTFSRGGSDITGALVASATVARVYENWTDVDGMMVTDPRIVPEASVITTITYPELRELAYQGATVLHEDAVLPVKEAGIPIHIRNTFRPEAPGSLILPSTHKAPGYITGIAGRKGYATITIEKNNTNSVVGYVRRILSCLEKFNVPFEHMATGNGSVCLAVPAETIRTCRNQLEHEIKRAICPDSITIAYGMAMLAVVGRGMLGRVGVAAQVFSALAEANVSARLIDQGCSQLNIVIGVLEEDYEASIRAIYNQFFRGRKD